MEDMFEGAIASNSPLLSKYSRTDEQKSAAAKKRTEKMNAALQRVRERNAWIVDHVVA
jgi:hypothetical protein